MIINYLCMKYYHELKDKFDSTLHGTSMGVTANNVCLRSKIDVCAKPAFLANVARVGFHHWKFEVSRGTLRDFRWSNLCIGIWNDKIDPEANTEELNYYLKDNGAPCYYGLNGVRGALRGGIDGDGRKMYCKPVENDDIIEMYLDLKLNELKYSVNGKDCGKAFDVESGEYRAVIGLSWLEEKVELLQYNYY